MSPKSNRVQKTQAQLHNAARESLDVKVALGSGGAIFTGTTGGILLFQNDKQSIRSNFQVSSTQIASAVQAAPTAQEANVTTTIPYAACTFGVLSLALCAWTHRRIKLRDVYFGSARPT